MLREFRRKIRDRLFAIRRLVGLERSLILQGEIRAAQIRQQGKLPCLADAEFSVFSQWGEDGILAWLTHVAEVDDKTFIEFGVEDFRESNCRYLMMSKHWSGLIIDGSEGNIASVKSDDIAYKFDLEAKCSFITKENINGLLAPFATDKHVGILSIDIDGVDYWVAEAIDISADIIVVEYNEFLGPQPVSVPYDPAFVRLQQHPSGMYWGASLAAFRHLFESRSYVFVGTNLVGTNAFFIHKDKAERVSQQLENFTAFPCKMREARTAEGDLAYKRYDQMGSLIDHLPLVDVSSQSETTVGKARA